MALIECPECGNQTSDKAATCPKCGCPIKELYDPETIAKKVEDVLEGYRLERAAGFYKRTNDATRNNISSYTDFPVEELKQAKGVIPKNAETDTIIKTLSKARADFEALEDGGSRYKQLVFSLVKVAFNPKYHAKWVKVFNCYDVIYLLDNIGLQRFSPEEIIELARIAMEAISPEDELRGSAFRHLRKSLPENRTMELLSAFGVSDERKIPDEPFFEEALADWEECKSCNREFDYCKWIDLNSAAKEVGKENAEAHVKKEKAEIERRIEEKKKAERSVRAGHASNGKAPACCPSCKSILGWNKVATGTSGASAGKAAAGVAIAGTAGGIVGAALGKKVDTYRCSECGFTHDYPHSSENKNGVEALEAHKEQMKRNIESQPATWGEVGQYLLITLACIAFMAIMVSCAG